MAYEIKKVFQSIHDFCRLFVFFIDTKNICIEPTQHLVDNNLWQKILQKSPQFKSHAVCTSDTIYTVKKNYSGHKWTSFLFTLWTAINLSYPNKEYLLSFPLMYLMTYLHFILVQLHRFPKIKKKVVSRHL